jgi:hypothetical protein
MIRPIDFVQLFSETYEYRITYNSILYNNVYIQVKL